MTTYYDTLGISKDASQGRIRKAFENLVKEKHPDQSDHPNAAQQFVQIKEAYDVLSDPEQRRRYDELGHDEYMREISGREATGRQSDEDIGAPDQTTDEGDAVGWQSYTRGSQEATYIWEVDTDRVAEKRASAHTGDRGVARRAVAYSLVTAPILIMMIMLYDLWTGFGPELEIALMLNEVLPAWAGTAVLVGIGLLCVSLAEIVLDTDRRVYSLNQR